MWDFFKLVPKSRRVKLRKRNGILFSNPSGFKKYLFYFANIVFVFFCLYLGYLYWPLVNVVYKFNSKKIDIAAETKIAQTLDTSAPSDFYVHIPKIGAKAKIVFDVSPYNKNEYEKVLNENNVALARNSDVPGSGLGKSSYIFAHSSQMTVGLIRKNAVFYLLNQVKNDDLVYVKTINSVYIYKIIDKKVISASETEYINFRDKDKELLILQTCYPIGTNWKRLLVFAEKL